MKKMILSLLLLCFFSCAFTQDFAGFRSGNYTGVQGVFFNPANIADNRYRLDINLFSLSTYVGNNQASFKLSTVSKTFDDVGDPLFGDKPGPSSALVHVDFHGPSVLFNAGKTTMAITTRGRAMANVMDMDGKLVKQLTDDINNNAQLPYTVASDADMRLVANSWTEIGVSAARVISEKGSHFFKAGISVKYLGGIGNAYMNLSRIHGTLNEDLINGVYLGNATGTVTAGFGGMNISNLEAADFTKMHNWGLGTDLGLVYEFRPAYQPDSNAYKGKTAYTLRLGLALLDLGSIKYTRDLQRSGSYQVDITGTERFYSSELSGKEIDEYNSVFLSRPQYFSPVNGQNAGTYTVALPGTIQLDADYHLKKGFFANLAAQIPLTGDKMYNGRYYTSITLTPRYEGRAFGFYLPVNYNSLTKMNAGISLRMGPSFIGSGSIISALIGGSKQADFHFGFHVPLLRRG
jgi:hypothetical protein